MTSKTLGSGVDEWTPDESSPGGTGRCRGVDMETDWEHARLEYERTIEQMLSERNAPRVKQAIEAYKRDLPQLLREDKARHFVAYDGNTRVGLAKTREKLLAELKRKGFAGNRSLFIKIISALEDSVDTSSSSRG
jgi:hypothetical protein